MAQASDSGQRVPCISCGYDLRATSPIVPCPECGTPTEHSILGYRVDGQCLVLRRNARLPQRCALTNVPVLLKKQMKAGIGDPAASRAAGIVVMLRLTEQRRRLAVASWWVMVIGIALLVFINLPWRVVAANSVWSVVLLVYVFGVMLVMVGSVGIWPRSCELLIQQDIARSRERRVWLRAISVFLVLLYVVFVMFVWLDKMQAVLLGWGISFAFSIFIAATFTRPPFTVARVQENESWITGCCDAYLEHCRAERQRMLDAAQSPATASQPSGGDDCPSA